MGACNGVVRVCGLVECWLTRSILDGLSSGAATHLESQVERTDAPHKNIVNTLR